MSFFYVVMVCKTLIAQNPEAKISSSIEVTNKEDKYVLRIPYKLANTNPYYYYKAEVSWSTRAGIVTPQSIQGAGDGTMILGNTNKEMFIYWEIIKSDDQYIVAKNMQDHITIKISRAYLEKEKIIESILSEIDKLEVKKQRLKEKGILNKKEESELDSKIEIKKDSLERLIGN
jgi:hypothetical protein